MSQGYNGRDLSTPVPPTPGLTQAFFQLPSDGFLFAITLDRGVRRAVMLQLWLRLALELGNNALGEDLAEFHAPLVEGIDLPDGALRKYGVFIQGDKLP